MRDFGSKRLIDIRKKEVPAAAGMFLFFFCVIAAFWILKPLRTSSVFKALGPLAYPAAKFGTSVILIPVALLFGTAAPRVPRRCLLAASGALFLGLFGASYAWFSRGITAPELLGFFFIVDVFNTVMVALFWTFLHESSTPDQARRLYGLIGAGGLLGGLAGSSVSGWMAPMLGERGLVLAAAAVFLLGLVSAFLALPGLGRPERPMPSPAPASENRAFPPYLALIAALVVLYETSSTIVDFLFNDASSKAHVSTLAMAAYQGKVASMSIALGLLVQVALTSLILRRAGMRAALLVLPAVLLLGTAGMAASSGLAAATVLFASDGSLHYSINQTAREALYTPLGKAAIYRGKAMIDLFVFRASKGAASLLLLGVLAIAASLEASWTPWLLGFNVLIILAWIGAALAVARPYETIANNAKSR